MQTLVRVARAPPGLSARRAIDRRVHDREQGCPSGLTRERTAACPDGPRVVERRLLAMPIGGARWDSTTSPRRPDPSCSDPGHEHACGSGSETPATTKA